MRKGKKTQGAKENEHGTLSSIYEDHSLFEQDQTQWRHLELGWVQLILLCSFLH